MHPKTFLNPLIKKLTFLCMTAGALNSPDALAMFCPTNFNQIEIGDTMAMVETKCGKPSALKNTAEEDENVPQEWTYYATLPPDPLTSVGSVKVVLAFVNAKVVNISSGGYSVGATTICNGNTVQIGNTIKQVIAACGQAAMVTKGAPRTDIPLPKATVNSEWKYNSSPPATLKFTNGKLMSRE